MEKNICAYLDEMVLKERPQHERIAECRISVAPWIHGGLHELAAPRRELDRTRLIADFDRYARVAVSKVVGISALNQLKATPYFRDSNKKDLAILEKEFPTWKAEWMKKKRAIVPVLVEEILCRVDRSGLFRGLLYDGNIHIVLMGDDSSEYFKLRMYLERGGVFCININHIDIVEFSLTDFESSISVRITGTIDLLGQISIDDTCHLKKEEVILLMKKRFHQTLSEKMAEIQAIKVS